MKSKTVSETYYAQVKWRADQVKSGMTRLEVEALFRHSHGGVQAPGITIYYQARGAKVEVPFDSFGGPCSVKNRVIGPAKVFLELGENYKFYKR